MIQIFFLKKSEFVKLSLISINFFDVIFKLGYMLGLRVSINIHMLRRPQMRCFIVFTAALLADS